MLLFYTLFALLASRSLIWCGGHYSSSVLERDCYSSGIDDTHGWNRYSNEIPDPGKNAGGRIVGDLMVMVGGFGRYINYGILDICSSVEYINFPNFPTPRCEKDPSSGPSKWSVGISGTRSGEPLSGGTRVANGGACGDYQRSRDWRRNWWEWWGREVNGGFP